MKSRALTARREAACTPFPARRRQRGALQALLAILCGCTATAPQPRGVLPAAPAARLAAVQANEERIHSLRARFDSVAHLPDADRSADGVLLVVKPDRFRMRLMLPFGFTVFDYLCVGEQTWVSLPMAGEEERARVNQFAPFSREDFRQAFLRGSYAFPGTCEAAPAPNDQVWVTCRDADVLRRTVLIGSDGIIEEATYSDGVQRLLIRYRDYRSIDGAALPFRITLEYPQQRQSVDITIERYEVNPALSDDLFRPPAGAQESTPPPAQS
jgi:outer membrane biogenesis lipoprotein LolB